MLCDTADRPSLDTAFSTRGECMQIVVRQVARWLNSADYSLLITRRFREELSNGREIEDAIAWTISTAGQSILCSALIVIIGFSGLILIGIGMTTSLGLGALWL